MDQLPAKIPMSYLVPVAKPLPPDCHPARVYIASLPSRASQRNTISRLLAIAKVLIDRNDPAVLDELPWHQIKYQHVAAVRAKLAQKYKPASVNASLAALRGVMREAYALDLIDGDTLQRIRTIKNIKGNTLPAGRVPVWRELQKLFDVCKDDASPAGARDAALIALLIGAGLRRAEAASLDRRDYNVDTCELIVKGKGRSERLVPITNGTVDALAAWLEIRGDEPGPLFWRVNKGGRIVREGISQQVPLDVLTKRRSQAGLKQLTPHDLRRSFATYLLDAGADVFSVQKLMGHAQTQTTLRYDRRDEQAKRKAVELLAIPY